MIDPVSELQGRVQRSRAALEGLAERAAALRARVAEAIAEADARAAGPAMMPELQLVDDVGEDGDLPADEWEIALINEECK